MGILYTETGKRRLINYIQFSLPFHVISRIICELFSSSSQTSSMTFSLGMRLWFYIGVLIISAMADYDEAYQFPIALPGCSYRCGEVEIPYPFGLTPECSLNEAFLVTCKGSFNPNKPFIDDVPITSISVEDGELGIESVVAKYCYDADGKRSGKNQTFLDSNQFTVSTKNIFTVIGCSTVSMISGIFQGDETYITACASFCSSYRNMPNGSCSGVGCCQMTIPGGLKQVRF